ncbi:allophanate hydrolase subunit 1 [Shimia sp.]|uniref:5-oxoprolinase subunit B family protein n=1 Tax=Shimia sp. TaxID=1954381 RepID=UPI003297B02A
MQTASFYPVADHALLVQLGSEISDALTARVLQLDQAIAANPPLGLRETVPAFVNLLAEFDPLVTDHHEMETAIRALFGADVGSKTEGAQREVLICYEDDLAPDLTALSEATGMTPDAITNMHLSGDYTVGMYGFAPGYAYLSGVPELLQVPRKPAAVRGIPAGSVIIAGPQCLVTTLTMPTGWTIIGRSPTEILTNDPVRPFLFDVGDRVKFRRIDRATFDNQTLGRVT